MYCGVPAMMPQRVSDTSSAARARPKSVSTARSTPFSSRMLAGFTSRCTRPCSWAAASPAAACMPMRRISLSSSRPCAAEPLGQRLAGHQRHDQKRQPPAGLHLVDRQHVGMHHGRGRLGLAGESLLRQGALRPDAGESTLMATQRFNSRS